MEFPKRIICLTEESTELLYLLGEEKRIAGISVYAIRPRNASSEKPKVSSFISGNIKKIKSLNPDFIIGFSDIQADLASELIKEGLNVLVTNQRTIDEIFDTMMLIGSIVGRKKDTTNLIQEWKNKIELIQEKAVHRKFHPRVFFQEWDEPIISAIKWVSEAIEICGGIDINKKTTNHSLASQRIVSSDEIAIKNPDIIIGSWCGKPVDFDWIRNKIEWKNVNAILQNQIYEVDSSIILQPGPALFLEGLQEINRILDSYES